MAAPRNDPLGYWPGRTSAYADRALAGEAHALFTASPDGAVTTASRVARLRPLVEAATRGSGIDPNLLEGLVFVESAGRPGAVVGANTSGAAGLTQILPSTAPALGLRVDAAASQRLTTEIANGGSPAAVRALVARRERVDQRFDPALALAATVHYLSTARAQFGREDLAFVSYHMGVGNLQAVLNAYDGGTPVPYPQLFFDSTPTRHAAAFGLMSGFSDQSELYYWRVLAAAALMHMYRTDDAALVRLAGLEMAADSTELVLHPPDRSTAYADPEALNGAYADGQLAALPSNALALGLVYASSIEAPAAGRHVPGGLYRGLAPAALNALLTISTAVQRLSGAHAPLELMSAVIDRRAQAAAGLDDPPAAGGWSFTIARRYADARQAQALQAVLDRLQALNLVAWTAQGSVVQVTVASDAGQVLAQGP